MALVDKLFGYIDKLISEFDDYTGWIVVALVLLAAGKVFKMSVKVGGGK